MFQIAVTGTEQVNTGAPNARSEDDSNVLRPLRKAEEEEKRMPISSNKEDGKKNREKNRTGARAQRRLDLSYSTQGGRRRY